MLFTVSKGIQLYREMKNGAGGRLEAVTSGESLVTSGKPGLQVVSVVVRRGKRKIVIRSRLEIFRGLIFLWFTRNVNRAFAIRKWAASGLVSTGVETSLGNLSFRGS
jgi:hypothetical protein